MVINIKELIPKYMTNPYDPSEQLLNQIIVLENKITDIMSRNNNKSSPAIKQHRRFIKDKQSLLSRLHKIHREM